MAKNKETTTNLHIVIFVEGDTDEVFFKALIEYYKQISTTPILPCSICNLKGITRYTSKLLAKLKNEYLRKLAANGTAYKQSVAHTTQTFLKSGIP